MKTKVALPLIGVLSVLAVAAAFFCQPLPTTITPENADRIKPGMSYGDVVALLGEPRHEVEKNDPRAAILLSAPALPSGRAFAGRDAVFLRVKRCTWTSERANVDVDFLDDGPGASVLQAQVSTHEFPSTSAHLHWRARRVLGLAPDIPTTGVVMMIKVPGDGP